MQIVAAEIYSNGKKIRPSIEIISIHITRTINRIPYAELAFLVNVVGQDSLSNTVENSNLGIGSELIIKLGWEAQRRAVKTMFKGLVIKQQLEIETEAIIRLELKDVTLRLTGDRNSRLFENKKDDEIIKEILNEANILSGEIDETALKHASMVQYNCSDWDFVLARAKANALLLVVKDGIVGAKKMIAHSSADHEINYGLSEVYSLELNADNSRYYSSVTAQSETSIRRVKKHSKSLLNQALNEAEIIEARYTYLKGEAQLAGQLNIELLDSIAFKGFGKQYEGVTIVTSIKQEVDENGWFTVVGFGLKENAYPRFTDVMELPAAGQLPGVHGLQFGVVDDFSGKRGSADFRIGVVMYFGGDEKVRVWARSCYSASDQEDESLAKGDGVVLGFWNDDPRQPIILGVLNR